MPDSDAKKRDRRRRAIENRLGKTWSDEVKKKISESMKAAWARRKEAGLKRMSQEQRDAISKTLIRYHIERRMREQEEDVKDGSDD